MKRYDYIAYLTSGLGNRLRPLASAIAYCELTGRRLRVYWDQITPNGCLAPLDSLFLTHFNLITLDEIATLSASNVGLFTEKGNGHGAEREAVRFGRPQLYELSKLTRLRESQSIALDEPFDTVIVYDNDYLKSIPIEKSISALRSLKPVEAIVRAVENLKRDCGLELNTKSVHARGTDFNISDALSIYRSAIEENINIKEGERFFLSTEDRTLEEGLKNCFGDLIITRSNRRFIERNSKKQTWNDPDSFTITAEQGLDALIDVYSLSQTTMAVWHPASTFAEISRHLHAVDLSSRAVPRGLQREFLVSVSNLGMGHAKGEILFPEARLYGPVEPMGIGGDFLYWETLGYKIPFLKRMLYSGKSTPQLNWDAEIFEKVLQAGRMEKDLFNALCPYPEAFSQLSSIATLLSGKSVMILGSESYWLELFCLSVGASSVTTVEYRPIVWTRPLSPSIKVSTVTWDIFLSELGAKSCGYDVVLSYSSLEHSGLGRYGDQIMPLGDLWTFFLLSKVTNAGGFVAVAVPSGKDLVHFNAHRIYGPERVSALEKVSGLELRGMVTPNTEYITGDKDSELLGRSWDLESLLRLPVGEYRQPLFLFQKVGKI